MTHRPLFDARQPAGAAAAPLRPAVPDPAATVVLLRPGVQGFEVLLTRRPSTMAFGPGIHVFPGGRVDPADASPEALRSAGLSVAEATAHLGLDLAPDGATGREAALAYYLAAVRETREETGIQVAASQLIPLSRWVTPVSLARRYDARFFAAVVPRGTQVEPRSAEVAAATWLAPNAALAAAERGEIELWQPTFVTLQQLVGLEDIQAVRAAFAVGRNGGDPVIERLAPDLARVDAAWAGGIPGRRGRGLLVGVSNVIVVDPSDPTGDTTEAIRREVEAIGGRLTGVVVTSLAPGCHAGVEMFARGLGLPVAVPSGLGSWAPYPRLELGRREQIPFADPGVTVAMVLRERRRWPGPVRAGDRPAP